MKQWKSPLLALAAAALLSGQTHAAEQPLPEHSAVLAPQTVAVLNMADMQSIFESTGQPMQLAALSAQEMKETEGSANPVGALIGAGGGGLGALIEQAMADPSEWRWEPVVDGMIDGGIAGFLVGPGGLAIWVFNGMLARGMLSGLMEYYDF